MTTHIQNKPVQIFRNLFAVFGVLLFGLTLWNKRNQELE